MLGALIRAQGLGVGSWLLASGLLAFGTGLREDVLIVCAGTLPRASEDRPQQDASLGGCFSLLPSLATLSVSPSLPPSEVLVKLSLLSFSLLCVFITAE